MDISHWIAHRAAWSPEKIATRFEGRETSYAEMEACVARLAGALRDDLGVGQGDRVAHLGYNSDHLLHLLFACARVGAILVPLNWRLTAHEHGYQISDCGPSVILVEPDWHGHVDGIRGQFPDVRAVAYGGAPSDDWQSYDDLIGAASPRRYDGELDLGLPVLIVYTSGTTGRPKGAVLTQNALFHGAVNSTAVFDMTSADHVITCIPMFHVGGMNIMTVPAMHAGATVTIHAQFDPAAVLAEIAASRPTLMIAVPAIGQALAAHPDFATTDISCFRCVCTGSSTVPEATFTPWHDRGMPITQVYGLTESGPTVTAVPIALGFTHSVSAGKAVLHAEARVVDDEGNDCPPGISGEIWLRGPNMLKEYWNNPEATAESFAEGGWFKTGDVAHTDDDGWIFVDDRQKEVIISGGENIYPAELENILADCADIAEFSVIGRAHEKWGETPVCCVLQKEGATLTKETVLALFDDRVARYKRPSDVIFLEQPLPRTSLGKVQKFELRKQLGF
jgi:fatty-acyl-CoA synthase